MDDVIRTRGAATSAACTAFIPATAHLPWAAQCSTWVEAWVCAYGYGQGGPCPPDDFGQGGYNHLRTCSMTRVNHLMLGL